MYEDYRTASKTQAGAGTANILAAPGTGLIDIVGWISVNVFVAGAGTYHVRNSGTGTIIVTGSTVAVHHFSMPVGRHTVGATETLDLIVTTAGSVDVHVLYKPMQIPPR